MSELNTCNCCKGLSPETPLQLYNRPGLNAIAYRTGTYHEFRESLLSRLSGSAMPALHGLTTRNNDDFSIALLDSWAIVSDVLTFYQERIANESYLRTAAERFSILQQARLIGYELRPGVAASTYLAFTLDETVVPVTVPGMEKASDPLTPGITISSGIKVQSIPGPGEQAQTFETIEQIEARPEWNTIKPRLLQPQEVNLNNSFFIVKDIINDLKKGDVLLLILKDGKYLKKILNVAFDLTAKTTCISIKEETSIPPYADGASQKVTNFNVLSEEIKLNNKVVSDNIVKNTWKEEDLSVLIEMNKWSVNDLSKSINKVLDTVSPDSGTGIFVFRKTARPFGYNAVKQVDYYPNRTPKPASEWKEWVAVENCNHIYLDSEYKEIVPGSYIGVSKPDGTLDEVDNVFKIQKADSTSRSAYGMNGKSTLLELDLKEKKCWYETIEKNLSGIRGITLYVQSEQLVLADLPIDDLIREDVITLDHWYPGLKAGQKIILSGERNDLKGTMASELMELKEVLVEKGYTVIRFSKSLVNTYIRSSVTINANVVLASHGETVKESLGSGDASMSFQHFTLRQPPLTYVSSSSVTGVETTLKVYVNDILWHEVETFFERTSEERIYITRLDNEGKTTIIFGDGITGSRLPTGTENIKAIYRKGIGLGGLVKANQLSQLMTRPLGVKAAVNPLPSNGAADAEKLEEARRNAPLTILTLGRVVSLQDYEDFARAFPGIEKSLATWTWGNQRRLIFLTVAGTNGATISKDDLLYQNLLKAIGNAGDRRVSVIVKSYKPKFFRLAANIKVNTDYLPEKVLPAVEQQLRLAFLFSSRSFGQPVSLSEVFTVCQQVEGVVAVDIDKLYYSDDKEGLSVLLKASIPLSCDETASAAELLTLDPGPLGLKLLQ